jgi:NAD+ kinase
MAELRALGHKVTEFHHPEPARGVQFAITLGGDGTVLRSARILCRSKIPMLPVFLGGLGLLTEISLLEIKPALELIKKKKYHLDPRMMLDVNVYRNGKRIKNSIALNDAVIGKSSIARTIKLEAFLKGKSIADYVGDGLIISTPTGSTAYNFAVNGPIIPPHGKTYVLSPICPHRAANRSIVLQEPVSIRIQKGEDNLLTIDGQETFKLKKDDEVRINISAYRTDFIRLKEFNLWDLLRTKLGWG